MIEGESMTVMELIVALDESGAANDAIVFIEADHGQNKEEACSLTVSRTARDSQNFGDPDAMIWEWDVSREELAAYYDDDALDDYDFDGEVTAVLISY